MSKSTNAEILSKCFCIASKRKVHIFNMPERFVQSFKLIIQTFHSVLARNCKISKSKNSVIWSKMFFILFQKEVHIFHMPEAFVRSFRIGRLRFGTCTRTTTASKKYMYTLKLQLTVVKIKKFCTCTCM